MSQQSLDRAQWYAACRELRGERVSERVPAKVSELRCLTGSVEEVLDLPARHVVAVRPREDESGGLPSCRECDRQVIRDRDVPDSIALRRADDAAHDVLRDGDAPVVEVHGAPLKRADLAEAESGAQGEQDHRACRWNQARRQQAFALDFGQEVEGRDRGLERTDARHRGQVLPVMRGVEALAQDGQMVVHALRAESGGDALGLERLNEPGSDGGQLESPKRWQEVVIVRHEDAAVRNGLKRQQHRATRHNTQNFVQ